jgi:ribosome-binding ATPase YchF (GTP1/OBG family)
LLNQVYSVKPLVESGYIYQLYLVTNELFFPFQRGTKAPQAAGRIHTDFEKGFIMAEVMKFDDFKAEGSESACKVGRLGFFLGGEFFKYIFLV